MRELLEGIMRHFPGGTVQSITADADIVTIRTDIGEMYLRLAIDDDGVGFSTWERGTRMPE